MTFLRRSFSGGNAIANKDSNIASDYLWACIKKGSFPDHCSDSMRQELEGYIPKLIKQTNPEAPSFKDYLRQLNPAVFMKEVSWMYYYACLIPEIKALDKESDYLSAAQKNPAISYAINVGNPFVLNFYCAGLTNQLNQMNAQFEKNSVGDEVGQHFKLYFQETVRIIHLIKIHLHSYPVLACFLLATINHHLSSCYSIKNNKEYFDEKKDINYLATALYYTELGLLVTPDYVLQTKYLTRGYDLFHGYFVKDFASYQQYFVNMGKLTKEKVQQISENVKQHALVLQEA